MAQEVHAERDASRRMDVRVSGVGVGDTGTLPDPRPEEIVGFRDQVSADIPGPVSDICDRLFGTEGIEGQRAMARQFRKAVATPVPDTSSALPTHTTEEIRRAFAAAAGVTVIEETGGW